MFLMARTPALCPDLIAFAISAGARTRGRCHAGSAGETAGVSVSVRAGRCRAARLRMIVSCGSMPATAYEVFAQGRCDLPTPAARKLRIGDAT
jgi:hypothetical protein